MMSLSFHLQTMYVCLFVCNGTVTLLAWRVCMFIHDKFEPLSSQCMQSVCLSTAELCCILSWHICLFIYIVHLQCISVTVRIMYICSSMTDFCHLWQDVSVLYKHIYRQTHQDKTNRNRSLINRQKYHNKCDNLIC